ncbi:DNA repair protein RecN [Glaciecola siphonariae]|uniref:DNA repair protein RecN n=1 Tax=Glaciecola siphonariae TaxID=521012 RepID=A0ABV9LU93_9ALTE
MLVHIDIKNFTVVKHVELSLHKGLTAITGETGAGKSIALDALGLCLGQRAESNIVRQGAQRAEVVTHFDINKLPKVKAWLNEQMLAQDDNPDECFIRRVVSKEGRSKAFINGVAVTLAQLKSLGAMVAHIHGQNDHHQFLKPDNQLALLDGYAQHSELLAKTKQAYLDYSEQSKRLKALQLAQQQRLDRVSLLQYQVDELDLFALSEGEFEQLEADFKKLNSVQELIESAEKSCYLLKDDEQNNALSLLNSALRSLADNLDTDPALKDAHELLQGAVIQAEEAYTELSHYQSGLETDPEQLKAIEQRYASALDLARKHAVAPENLHICHAELAAELALLQSEEASLADLEASYTQTLEDYRKCAHALHKSRQVAADKLSEEIAQSIKQMNLPHAVVSTTLTHHEQNAPSAKGNDEIRLLVSVNPGQAPDVLEKVVSGGELARIGLAIQVIRSRDYSIPTLVFDEVDTGISGQTASIVGKLLNKLGAQSQVICVTHLPQVAAQGHHQLFVTKLTDGVSTETKVLKLTKEERVNEIARLLAGDELTDTAIANAKDLLKQ